MNMKSIFDVDVLVNLRDKDTAIRSCCSKFRYLYHKHADVNHELNKGIQLVHNCIGHTIGYSRSTKITIYVYKLNFYSYIFLKLN